MVSPVVLVEGWRVEPACDQDGGNPWVQKGLEPWLTAYHRA